MVKLKSQYICQSCEHSEARWFGRCPNCNEWNTAVETVVSTAKTPKSQNSKIPNQAGVEPINLSSIETKATKRITTSISELDRVLGGGIVPGQVILIAGEPGIGKSTILLQVANELSLSGIRNQLSDVGKSVGKTGKLKNRKPKTDNRKTGTVLYASGEESARQIKIRSDRMKVTSKNIEILETTDIDSVIEEVSKVGKVSNVSNGKVKKPSDTFDTSKSSDTFLIVDSIQTMSTPDLSGMAGSVGQVRECTYRLVRFAKANNIPVFIVGHITKTGTVAGPSVLAHLVDTVLWFEGDKNLTLRMLRAVKNRFGPTDEVGVFTMEDKGLVSQNNPEKMFLGETKGVPGNVTTMILQGTRPILAEIQALVVPTKMAFAKRVVQGVDLRRVELLLAVLQRRCSLPMSDYDVFVSVAGGISIKGDPSADLAICLSIASAYYDKQVSNKTLAIGEIGLLGDIRSVPMQEKRIKEARRLGYKNIVSGESEKYLRDVVKKLKTV